MTDRSAGLLTTKIMAPPRLVGMLPRPALVTAIQAGLDAGARLVLVSAPAGSGKTSLVVEWAGTTPARVAWLALGTADNDPRTFWTYLVASLQSADPDLGSSVRTMLTFPLLPPVQTIVAELADALPREGRPVVLVLDDYQQIVEPSLHEGLAFLLDHLPPALRIVVASRADPPLPLSRLRVRGWLCELRSADLRFSATEVAAVVSTACEVELGTAAVEILVERTEGWPAGVRLATILLVAERRRDHRASLDGLVEGFSGQHRLVLDYIIDEVLARQPDDVQRFLLRTCILDRFSSALCDALDEDGGTGSAAMLDRIERANLFLVPLDAHRTWFRYHHLFADALRTRAERLDGDSASALHRRAAGWLSANGFVDEGIEHALAAGDVETAARWMDASAEDTVRQGRQPLVLRWISRLPDDVARRRPHLSVAAARADVLSGRPAEGLARLERLEAADGGRTALDPVTAGAISTVRATAAFFSADLAGAQRHADRALALLPQGDRRRTAALLCAGDAASMSGEPELGARLLTEAVGLARRHHDVNLGLFAAAHLAETLLRRGRLRAAAELCAESIDDLVAELGDQDWPVPALSLVFSRAGHVARERNDLAAGERLLRRARSVADRSDNVTARADACEAWALLRRSAGDVPGALDTVERALRRLRRSASPLFVRGLDTLRAELWLRSGDLSAARRWAEDHRLRDDQKVDYFSAGELSCLVRLLTLEGRAAQATALADRLATPAQTRDAGRVIEALALKATAEARDGRLAAAVRSTERALELAEPEGFVRALLDEGDALHSLLRRVGRTRAPAAHYARVLLHQAGPPRPRREASLLVEPLTSREQEVLRLLADGASNAEVAQRLVVSVGTVKAHVSHLTAKLGARSRTDAVIRARRAGVLRDGDGPTSALDDQSDRSSDRSTDR